jgi:hypothetical protein
VITTSFLLLVVVVVPPRVKKVGSSEIRVSEVK